MAAANGLGARDALSAVTIDAARIFDKIFIMTKGGPGSSTYSLTFTIYIQGFTKFDLGYTAALSCSAGSLVETTVSAEPLADGPVPAPTLGRERSEVGRFGLLLWRGHT